MVESEHTLLIMFNYQHHLDFHISDYTTPTSYMLRAICNHWTRLISMH